ncbi:uncharacterized protein LOC129747576 [Uranotaenia lowii]|uniref:uncharacterized protein LOC129747576 n=1 Tax=Uranotaenia lowii TaxID=190385 RepID=UPI00247ABCBA|nr:uncharacterized protein LOC129747576 [Uranotaenia lowii]
MINSNKSYIDSRHFKMTSSYIKLIDLQTPPKCNNITETRQQYTRKFPANSENAELVHCVRRLDYIKESLPRMRKELIIINHQRNTEYDSIAMPSGSNYFRFGYHCGKAIERPEFDIKSNETSYSKYIDPYMSTASSDFNYAKCNNSDDITFWNWRTDIRN